MHGRRGNDGRIRSPEAVGGSLPLRIPLDAGAIFDRGAGRTPEVRVLSESEQAQSVCRANGAREVRRAEATQQRAEVVERVVSVPLEPSERIGPNHPRSGWGRSTIQAAGHHG